MQKGFAQIFILFGILAIALVAGILGMLFYQKQLNSLLGVVPSRVAQPYSSIKPSLAPSVIPTVLPKPSGSSLCNCSWAMSSGTNVEFLVTSPSGQQEGYLQASNSYVNNLPSASYGVESGLSDDTGQKPPLPSSLYFGQSDPEIGVYNLQVIGKQPGKYVLDIRIAFGPGSGKVVSVEGALTTTQVDKYRISIPSGAIEKVSN